LAQKRTGLLINFLIEINERLIHDDLNGNQMNGHDHVIELRDLTKRYGGVVAVDRVTF